MVVRGQLQVSTVLCKYGVCGGKSVCVLRAWYLFISCIAGACTHASCQAVIYQTEADSANAWPLLQIILSDEAWVGKFSCTHQQQPPMLMQRAYQGLTRLQEHCDNTGKTQDCSINRIFDPSVSSPAAC